MTGKPVKRAAGVRVTRRITFPSDFHTTWVGLRLWILRKRSAVEAAQLARGGAEVSFNAVYET
ncbi:hypothetical protein LMG28138_06014 [Pararobbsia alpina]|uniref:Uncharacterized protein n=1 Tax=Pararobbsia alpina TaxID=621374 RepID=A0A6S7BP56_9BURK|nr:hypothetical protein LMG28138_06014 [Pararobbsia alpina]